jgi:hypothetical protein
MFSPRPIFFRTRIRLVQSQQASHFSGVHSHFLTIRSEAATAAALAEQDVSKINNAPNIMETGANATSNAEEMVKAAADYIEPWEPLLEKVQIFVNI